MPGPVVLGCEPAAVADAAVAVFIDANRLSRIVNNVFRFVVLLFGIKNAAPLNAGGGVLSGCCCYALRHFNGFKFLNRRQRRAPRNAHSLVVAKSCPRVAVVLRLIFPT